MNTQLTDQKYLAFPFRVGAAGPEQSSRVPHIKEQIEQVLFTNPGERVFRYEFGAGLKTLIFEPNGTTLWQITEKRLLSSLAEALQGEVDPRSIGVQVRGEEEKIGIVITYTLAAFGITESYMTTMDRR